jgi:hypothetical protein
VPDFADQNTKGPNQSHHVSSDNAQSISPHNGTGLNGGVSVPTRRSLVADPEKVLLDRKEFEDKVNAIILAMPRGGDFKIERAEMLTQISTLVKERLKEVSGAIESFVSNLSPLNSDLALCKTGAEKIKILEREIAREEIVRDLAGNVYSCMEHLKKGPLAAGRMEFSSSTGFSDKSPYLAATISAVTGVASLMASIPLILHTHHGMVHKIMEVCGAHGLIARVFSELAAVGPVITVATVLIAAGSVAGPLVCGSVKTLLGNFMRAVSANAASFFEAEVEASGKLQSANVKCCESAIKACAAVSDSILKFYSRNERIRQPLAEEAWRAVLEHEDRSGNLQRLQSSLGRFEERDIWQVVMAHNSCISLRSQEIRSPALIEASQTKNGLKKNVFANILTVGLQSSLASIINFVQTATATTGGALDVSDDIDKWCKENRTLLLAPAMALGSSVAHTYHVALASKDPVEAMMTAFQMFASAFNPDKEWNKSANIWEIVKIGLEFKELGDIFKPENSALPVSEKMRRLLFFAVKFPVNLAKLLFKKPLISLEIKLQHMMDGDPTPGLLLDELAKKQGYAESIKVGMEETLRHSLDTLNSTIRLITHTPLKIIAGLQANNSILGKIFPAKAIDIIKSSYERRKEKISLGKNGLRYYERILEDGPELHALNMDELKVHVLAEKAYYSQDGSGSDYGKMKNLIHYWELRRADNWLSEKIRTIEHIKELSLIDPRLSRLRHLARSPEVKAQSGVYIALSALTKLDTDLQRFEKMKIKKFPASALILDIADNGNFITLNKHAKIEEVNPSGLHQSSVRAFEKKVGGYSILPHADETRLAYAEAILGKLEHIQKAALLHVHYLALKNTPDLTAETAALLKNHFSPGQLLGTKGGTFPGIFRLGLLGNKIPSEEKIANTIKILNLKDSRE